MGRTSATSERAPLLINDDSPPVNNAEAGKTVVRAEGGHSEKNALGTINGCYVPCLLNIMGIVLFMRLPWATGQAGLSGIFGGIALAEAMALPTVLSLSAIVSNGDMRGGGAYFMISRSLGPELGGAIGILFYLAYAIGVSFYIIGFASEVQSSFTVFAECNCQTKLTRSGSCPIIDGHNYCQHGSLFVSSPEWTVAIIGSVALSLCLAISIKGAGFFAKFNVIFFAVQMGATLWGIISFLVPQDSINPHGATVWLNHSSHHANHHTVFLPHYKAELSLKNYRDNWEPHWEPSQQCLSRDNEPVMCDFRLMFAIIFPMATGIMEGANLSGDLANPSKSIPTGTLWALFTSCCTYIALVLCFAGAFNRETLLNDLNVFQNASLGSPFVVITGILISSFSSALGSLFGGSRVLQAISRDKLYPVLSPFAFGSKQGDEPRVAVIGTWIIAQACVLIGDLDIVAPIITSIFCLSYAFVNWTVFVLAMIGAPNFRPMFPYWNKWTALTGFCVNVGVLFFLDYEHASIGIALLATLTVYLIFRGPAVEWGDISQELMFHQVRKYLLLIRDDADPKYWKPNLLLLVDDPNLGVLGFCNNIKKGGLLVTGHVILGELAERFKSIRVLRSMWTTANKELGIKAFPHVTVAPTARLGYQFLMTCGGLGGLDVNTVVIPLLRGMSRSASGSSINNLFSASQMALNAADTGAKETSSVSVEEIHPGDRMADAGDPEQNDDADAKSTAPSVRSISSTVAVPVKDAVTYCNVLNDAVVAQKNIIVTRNFGTKLTRNKSGWFGAPKRMGHITANDPTKTYIDIWIIDDWGFDNIGTDHERCDHTVMLLFQLGQILKHKLQDDGHKLRVMYIPSRESIEHNASPPWNPCFEDKGKGEADLKSALKSYCNRMRVKPDYLGIIDPRAAINEADSNCLNQSMDYKTRASLINKIIAANSANTTQLFVAIPHPPAGSEESECGKYLHSLRKLSEGIPPVAMVLNGQDVCFVSSGM